MTLRVLEIGKPTLAVGFAGRVLSDSGADVRHWRDKSGITDGEPATGWRRFLFQRKAAYQAESSWDPDVVISSSLHITHDRTSGDHSNLAPVDCIAAEARWPSSARLCITDYGQAGPYADAPGNEGILFALSGLLDATPGYPDVVEAHERPVLSRAPLISFAAGLFGSLCARAVSSASSSKGAHVELSTLEVAAFTMVHEWGISAYTGRAQGRRDGPGLLEPNLCFQAKDGRGVVAALTDSQWQRMVKLLGLRDSSEHETISGRRAHKGQLHALLRERLAFESLMPLVAGLQSAGIPAGAFLGLSTAIEYAGLVLEEHVDQAGSYRVPRFPVEHRELRADSIGSDLGLASSTDLTSAWENRLGLRAPVSGPQASSVQRPLAGIRVLDLGRMKAAPFAGMLLAALGAEVIVIESAGHSVTRQMGPHLGPAGSDNSAAFNMVNRGKASVLLELKSKNGYSRFRELVASADVVIENFSDPGAKYLKVTLMDLVTANPSVVLGSVRGFDSSGPWSEWLALHSTVISLSGLGDLTRDTDGVPRLIGSLYPDMLAGSLLASTIVDALQSRSGLAQQIRVNMLDLLVYGMGGLVNANGPDGISGGDLSHGHVVSDQDRDPVYVTELPHQEVPLPPNKSVWPIRLVADSKLEVDVLTMLDVFRDRHLQSRMFVVTEERPDLAGVVVPGVPWLVDGNRPGLASAPTLPESSDGEEQTQVPTGN